MPSGCSISIHEYYSIVLIAKGRAYALADFRNSIPINLYLAVTIPACQTAVVNNPDTKDFFNPNFPFIA